MEVNHFQSRYQTKKNEPTPSASKLYIPAKTKRVFKNNIIESSLPIDRKLFSNENIKFCAASILSILFNISNKKITTSIYTHNRTEKDKTDDNSTEFKTVNIAVLGRYGMGNAVTEKIGVFIQPTAQISLLGMALDLPLKKAILNLGIANEIILK